MKSKAKNNLKRNIKFTVTCFIQKDGKWLMLRRRKDKKYLPGILNGPGGKIERDEGVLEAARRELLEETGVKAKNLRLKAVGVGRFEDSIDEYHFKVLVGDWHSGRLSSNDGEISWMDKDEILSDPDLLDELNHVLRRFFDHSHPIFTYKVLYKSPNNLIHIEIEE